PRLAHVHGGERGQLRAWRYQRLPVASREAGRVGRERAAVDARRLVSLTSAAATPIASSGPPKGTLRAAATSIDVTAFARSIVGKRPSGSRTLRSPCGAVWGVALKL